MNQPLTLAKYSIGLGDRFARQAKAQLRACMLAASAGVDVTPVWNKSHREHTIVASEPASVREAAEAAVRELGWTKPFHVDADHVRLETVEPFLDSSDFYTLDVADAIGAPASPEAMQAFVDRHPELVGRLEISGIAAPFELTPADLARMAAKYYNAVRQAGRLYRHIAAAKGEGTFIAEISMDETGSAQTPPELLVILAAIADEGIPAQTVAPKFSGRFNKGVDFRGDVDQFSSEFNDDLAVIAHAAREYELAPNLKLSVHSGSDKFSLYGPIREALERGGAGIHLKTAGTTWLEEVIGLAESGGEALALAREILATALVKIDALSAPYATVLQIDRCRLPLPTQVAGWSSEEFVAALRHDPRNPEYNPDVRQLLHVGFKVAARLGDRYLEMLGACAETIAKNVTENLYERHLKPLFIGR
jgi:tagaturonate epimerase